MALSGPDPPSMMSQLPRFLCIMAAFTAFATSTVSKQLPIRPVYQDTPVWCWATVGEMVFRYYGVPNVNPAGRYQCGIIGALSGPGSACDMNCLRCVVPAGSMRKINEVLSSYPQIVRTNFRRPSPDITSTVTYSALTKSDVRTEIDEGRPIIAGITPNGFAVGGEPMHVALIVGYEEAPMGRMLLTVNDPFPYDHVDFSGRSNPFNRAGGRNEGTGRYQIDFDSFRIQLAWGSSIYQIRSTGSATEGGGGPGRRVACTHRTACSHQTACVHQTACAHTGPCTHRVPCVHSFACQHPVWTPYGYRPAHPYDTSHPFDVPHAFDQTHPFDQAHPFDATHAFDSLHEFDVVP